MDLIRQLARITPMPTDVQLEQHPEYYDWHDDVMKRLESEMKPELIPNVLKTFGYRYANEGYYAVVHLLEEQSAELLHEALRNSLQNGQDGERMWAAHMLGRFEDAADFDLLAKQLSDRMPLVRDQVVTALSRQDDPRALPLLLKFQGEEQSADVQSSLEYAIKRLRE